MWLIAPGCGEEGGKSGSDVLGYFSEIMLIAPGYGEEGGKSGDNVLGYFSEIVISDNHLGKDRAVPCCHARRSVGETWSVPYPSSRER